MEQTLTVSWPMIAGVMTAMAVVVGAATAYLRLFINLRLAEHEAKMLLLLKNEFALKASFDAQGVQYNERFTKLESSINKSLGKIEENLDKD